MAQPTPTRREVLSNSRLNTASECDYKYHTRYFRKLNPTIESSFFLLGRVVHDTIEAFYKDEVHKVGRESEQSAWFLAHLDMAWANKFDDLFVSHLTGFREAYDKAIEQTLEFGRKRYNKEYKAPTLTKHWEDNFQELFDKKGKTIDAYTADRFPKIRFRKPAGVIYSDSVRCATNFIRLHQERGMPDMLFTELDIAPAIEVHGQLKGGRIDRVEVYEHPTGKEFRVYDYKTGATPWSTTKVANEDQLNWYAYSILERYSVQPTTTGVWDLFSGRVVDHRLDEADLVRFLKRLEGKIRKKGWLDEYFALVDRQGVEPIFNVPAGRDSDICRSCDYAIDPNPDIRCKFYQVYD